MDEKSLQKNRTAERNTVEIVITFDIDGVINTLFRGCYPNDTHDLEIIREIPAGHVQLRGDTLFYHADEKASAEKLQCIIKAYNNPKINALDPGETHMRIDHLSLLRQFFASLSERNVKAVLNTQRLTDLYNPYTQYPGMISSLFTALNAGFPHRDFLTERDTLELVQIASKAPSSLPEKYPNQMAEMEERNSKVPILNASRKLFPKATKHILVDDSSKNIQDAEAADYKNNVFVDTQNEYLTQFDHSRPPYFIVDTLIAAFGTETAIDIILKEMSDHHHILMPILFKRLGDPAKTKSEEKQTPTKNRTLDFYRNVYQGIKNKGTTPSLSFMERIDLARDPEPKSAIEAKSMDILKGALQGDYSTAKTALNDSKINLADLYSQPITDHYKSLSNEFFKAYTEKFLKDLMWHYQKHKKDPDIHASMKKMIFRFYAKHSLACQKVTLRFFHHSETSIAALLHFLRESRDAAEMDNFMTMIHSSIKAEFPPIPDKSIPVPPGQIWQRPEGLSFIPQTEVTVPPPVESKSSSSSSQTTGSQLSEGAMEAYKRSSVTAEMQAAAKQSETLAPVTKAETLNAEETEVAKLDC